jgi:CheY-like chemotaxis protein
LSHVASYNPQESPLSHTPRRPSHSNSRVLPVDHNQLSEPPVGYITLTVTDTGPGLTLEQQQSLFREGVQFNPNELQAGQGSGLGLWISKEIVSLHQGKIHVSSPGIGCGSTFEVSLPVVLRHSPVNSLRQCISRRQQGGAEEVTPQSALSDGSITSNPPCALIVDDAPSNRKLVSRLLKSRGFVCHEVENGQECVDLVTTGSPHFDLILMDYEMPVMDGPTAARKLRELKSEVLIIGLTGNVLPEDQEYFQKQGANLVLSKPLNIDKLLHHFHLFQKNPQHLV